MFGCFVVSFVGHLSIVMVRQDYCFLRRRTPVTQEQLDRQGIYVRDQPCNGTVTNLVRPSHVDPAEVSGEESAVCLETELELDWSWNWT